MANRENGITANRAIRPSFDDGEKSYLFCQGNKDNGATWWISNVEVKWNKSGPYLK